MTSIGLDGGRERHFPQDPVYLLPGCVVKYLEFDRVRVKKNRNLWEQTPISDRYKLYTVFPSIFLQQARQLEPFFAQRRVPYVCLPVQSAAHRVIDLMNRHYDPDQLVGVIARLRSLDPEVFVYSHFIFNFPTETWEEFEESVAFSRHFDHCVVIGYGENSETRAAALFPKCDNQTLQAKVQRLEDLVKRGELAAFVVPSP